jgi:anhydro-N-acetylmuramic acid kinase
VNKPERTVIGLHSGTSADGPTAVAVRVSGAQESTRIKVLACREYKYQSPLRERIFDLFTRESSTVDRLAQANMAIGEWFAESAKRIAATAGLRLDEVDLIASSGQVIYQVIEGQRPEHRWLGDKAITSFVDMASAAVIAERTGVTTVSNLRQRDIAAGGLGVPTVTYGDWVLFRDEQHNRSIQNIGGIANPTVIPAGADLDAVFAFDSGPGNMVIDGLIDAMTAGRLAYDEGGATAARGHVHQGLVDELMAHPFIQQAPPKGAARQLFGKHYALQVLQRGYDLGLSDSDILASATAFTAESIAFAYRRFVFPRVSLDEVFVAGGGARNATMMSMLRERLAPIPVATIEALGIPVEAREVLTMVVMANDTVQGYPGNVPRATGARRRVICGDITPGLDG